MRFHLPVFLLCLATGSIPVNHLTRSYGSAPTQDSAGAFARRTMPSDTGWFWFTACAQPERIVLELALDGRVLGRRTFAACHVAPDTVADSIQYHTDLTITFRAPRLLVWKGYRTDADTTLPGIQFDVDIWEVDPGPWTGPPGITFGVTADGPDLRYMNTFHTAIFGETDSTDLAEGLTLVTRPQRARSNTRGKRPKPRVASETRRVDAVRTTRSRMFRRREIGAHSTSAGR